MAKIEVRVGQVWEDCDWRSAGRLIEVLHVDQTHAVCTTGARRSRIRLDRFRPNSTGYQLVRDVPETPKESQ